VPAEVTSYANFLAYATQTYSPSSGINFDTAIGIRLFDQVNLGYWMVSKKGVFINVDISVNPNKEVVVLKRPSKTHVSKMRGGGGSSNEQSQAEKSVEVTTSTSAQAQSVPLTETSNLNLTSSTGKLQQTTGSHGTSPSSSAQFEGSAHIHASSIELPFRWLQSQPLYLLPSGNALLLWLVRNRIP
jgi:hypothetical protein